MLRRWVLRLDTGEVLSDELIEEILEVKKVPLYGFWGFIHSVLYGNMRILKFAKYMSTRQGKSARAILREWHRGKGRGNPLP